MNKINWKVRFKNKTWFTTFALTLIAFVYQMLSLFDIVPSIPEENIEHVAMLVITLLASLGIIVDPTTAGIKDSTQALTYIEPRISDEVK